jgi:redox-sensitive bicupin YhaK (pirin superfamily)
MHGLQIWIALPKDLEEMQPEFHHISQADIPTWNEDEVDFKLIAGEAFGKKSPVPVYSKLYMLEIVSKTRQMLNIGHELYGETGLYILEGSVELEGNTFLPKQIIIAKESSLCEFIIAANTTVYIFGGATFPEERFIDWNFVSSSKETIRQAKQNWENQTFDKIKGDDTEFVPYPTFKK